MIFCGVEEPISVNSQLHVRSNTSTGILACDEGSEFPLNRYTFVNRSEAGNASLTKVLDAIYSSTSTDPIAVSAWLTQLPNRSATASKVIASKLKKDGWQDTERDQHFIASKVLSNEARATWPFHDQEMPFVGRVVLFSCPNAKSARDILTTSSSFFLARNGYFVPDKEFFARIYAKGLGAIYLNRTNSGNESLVLLNARKIDIHAFEKAGIKLEVFHGPDAYRAIM